VAMQRYSNVVMVGIILPAAVIGAGLAGCSRAPAAKDSQAVSAAAQPMRQPRWLESYRDRTAARPQPVAEPPAPEAAPIAPAAPATLAADPKAAPVETSSALSAVELAIPDTPPASAEGKPGRALVRSRDTSTVDAHALLTAGWTDLVPSESAGPKPDDTATAPPEESPEKLGPDASVLQVEETQTADEGSTADPVAVKVEPESPSVEAAASPAAMANQPRPEVATYPDQVPPAEPTDAVEPSESKGPAVAATAPEELVEAESQAKAPVEPAPIASWAEQAEVALPTAQPEAPQVAASAANAEPPAEIAAVEPEPAPESEPMATPERAPANTPEPTATKPEAVAADTSRPAPAEDVKPEPIAAAAPAEFQPPVATDIAATGSAAVPEAAGLSLVAPVAEPPDHTPTLAIDPASFRGVFPGKTTRDEVEASWGKGEPYARDDGTTGLSWKVEPFERVEVILDGEAVGSILIKLAEPTSVRELATQLEIADIRTVSVLDDQGVSIGEVYPERGVIFSLEPGTQTAQAVILEPLDPESFVLRAERELEVNTAFATADLQYAIEIDPQHLRGLRLLLALRCEQGKWTEALALAQRAEAVDPNDIWTRLKHASVLTTLEQTAPAREKVESVRQQPNTSPLVVAQAERMLGRIQLGSAEPDYQKAVEHFSNAIKTSSPLLNAKTESAQKAARDVLLDAHLGTALAIAKGTWQQKARVIPKWITRSETIVNEAPIDEEIEKHALELQLCRGALAVAAGSTESFDPLPWVKRLLQVRAKLDGTTTDPWRRRQIDWEIGEGLSDALVATQKRGDAADMLENTTLTAAYLERGAEFRQLTATERKNLGDLLFRIGILYSLQKGDHATAVTWFDKALPLWEGNPAFARDGDLGQLGESLVSMAITYWQVDRRDDAVAINRKGIDLMVEAVRQQMLNEQSLAVAYGNLATMYAEQGDEENAQSYSDLATRAEATGTVQK
jgi:tetratricopeptide (TPR) repeat protein